MGLSESVGEGELLGRGGGGCDGLVGEEVPGVRFEVSFDVRSSSDVAVDGSPDSASLTGDVFLTRSGEIDCDDLGDTLVGDPGARIGVSFGA
jgi:hypothetical protein